MKSFIFFSFVLFYVSLGFLIEKAGYKMILGYIPIINIYYLSKALKTHIIIVIIFILGMIFLPIRNLIMTITYIFLPFIIAYYYSINLPIAIFTVFIPFIGYPIMALRGFYHDSIH